MAVEFLTGISVKGTLNLNLNQLTNVRIQNVAVQPSGVTGQIYYDSGTNKLRLYNGGWVDIQTGADGNTTYDLNVPSGTTAIGLDGSDGTQDNVTITGGTNVTVVRTSATELTINATDAAAGTVTGVSGGTGISISGSASVTPTVNIDTVGTDNAILVNGAGTPVGADTMWFSDATDNTIKKATIGTFPGFGKDGTVTSVSSTFGGDAYAVAVSNSTSTPAIAITAGGNSTQYIDGAGNLTAFPAIPQGDITSVLGGAGITVTSGTGPSPSVAVDYLGADNIILAAASGTGITVASTDRILVSDTNDSGNAKFVNISQITAAIGGGTVTEVDASGTVSGLSLSTSPAAGITGTGSVVLSGTLSLTSAQVVSGLGFTPYNATNPSGFTSFAEPGIFSGGGTPTLATNVTAAEIRSLIGAGQSSTTGTVTSVTAGAGMTQTGTSTVNPTLNVIASAGGGISVGTDAIAVDATVIRTTGVQTIGGTKTFSTQVIVPLTPTNNNNIASKAYVLSQIGGVGGFRGGYNASSNSPALSGGSNVAMELGDFFVVDVAGSTAGLGTLEPGDFVFADAAIAAGSSPAASAYTVVIADQNIAGVGANDGATTKGVAGFSSATFDGTSNGFITVKTGGISDGQLASTFNKIIGTDTDINTSGVDVVDQINVTDGVITSMSKRTLPTTSQTVTGVARMATDAEVTAATSAVLGISPLTLKNHINRQSFSNTQPASSANSWAITAATHGLGVGPFIIQTYLVETGAQLFCDVRVNSSNGTITFNTTDNQAASSIRCNIMLVR